MSTADSLTDSRRTPAPAAPPPAPAAPADALAVPADRPHDETLEAVQRLLVERALAAAGRALPKAAALLGIDKRRLGRPVDRLELER